MTRVYRQWNVMDCALAEESWFLEFVPFSNPRREESDTPHYRQPDRHLDHKL